ncbi:MAG: hypothetical protein WCR42_15160 [bacterium]
MEEQYSNIPTEIEALMLQKLYSELSDLEVNFVSEYFSEKEYTAMRSSILTLQSIKSAEKEIEVPAGLKSKLMAQFDRKKARKTPLIKKVTGFPVPAYGTFAISALVALIVFFFKPAETLQTTKLKIDTVYVERTVKEIVENTKVERISHRSERNTLKKATVSSDYDEQIGSGIDLYISTAKNNINLVSEETEGRSIIKDSSLLSYLRTSY